VKVGKRQSAAAGIAVAALLSLSVAACGSDDNSDEPSTPASGSASAGGASAINCATGSISGGGSSAQKNAMDEWIKAYQDACSGTTVAYASSSSGTGRQAFIDKQVDFAGSDSAIKDAQKTAAAARCTGGEVVDIPMVVGPIAVVYNISGVSDLKLSPGTVAKIFSGAITKWNDPAIKADNGSASLPDTTIASVHRSDSSGTTDNFTKFLAGAGGSDWTFGNGSDWKATGGQGSKGSDGIASTVKSTPGAIGYVELSYAENSGLSTAQLKNAAGEFVKVSTDGASKGVSTATAAAGSDLVLTFDYKTAVPGAYPAYLVSYEIVCTKGLDAAKGALVKSFLTYTSSEAGQASISDLGYAPLPSSVASKVTTVVGSLG